MEFDDLRISILALLFQGSDHQDLASLRQNVNHGLMTFVCCAFGESSLLDQSVIVTGRAI